MKNFTIFFLIVSIHLATQETLAHKEHVHQYICREAYQLLRTQIGRDICTLRDRIGNIEIGDGPFNPGGLVVIGAYQEDRSDVVWHYGFPHSPLRETAAVTHFWDADRGDNAQFCTHFCINPVENCYPNAYNKALKYVFGGWELQIFYPGTGITEAYEAPSYLPEFYKTGRIFYKGYYQINGSFVQRNYWTTSPQWLRNKVVWEILGRIGHLLQDSSVPAHAHNDQHDPVCNRTDDFENFMDTAFPSWNHTDALNAGGFINVNAMSNPIRYLFYTTNQIADHFPSNDTPGDNDPGQNESFANYPPLQDIIAALGPPPSTIDVNQIANTTFTYAIRATAGLFYWFAQEAGLLDSTNVRVTVETVPYFVGLKFDVDDNTYTDFQDFTWPVGSQHLLGIPNPKQTIPGVGEFRFWQWNVGDNLSHWITADACNSSYTAYFKAKYYLIADSPYKKSATSGLYDEGAIAYAAFDSDTAIVGEGVRMKFVEWTGDGAGTNFAQSDSILMDWAKTVTAVWKTQFELTIRAGPGGTTSPSGQTWHDSSASITITATPNSGYVFTVWSGDATGTTNPLTVVMNGTKTITANLEAIPPPSVPSLASPANGATNQPT